MSINLTPDLEERIQQQIASGGYPDASAVIREAMRLLEERAAKLAWLRQAIQEGLDSPVAPLDMEEIIRKAHAERDARRSQQGH